MTEYLYNLWAAVVALRWLLLGLALLTTVVCGVVSTVERKNR